jgi:hypothetical protein
VSVVPGTRYEKLADSVSPTALPDTRQRWPSGPAFVAAVTVPVMAKLSALVTMTGPGNVTIEQPLYKARPCEAAVISHDELAHEPTRKAGSSARGAHPTSNPMAAKILSCLVMGSMCHRWLLAQPLAFAAVNRGHRALAIFRRRNDFARWPCTRSQLGPRQRATFHHGDDHLQILSARDPCRGKHLPVLWQEGRQRQGGTDSRDHEPCHKRSARIALFLAALNPCARSTYSRTI